MKVGRQAPQRSAEAMMRPHVGNRPQPRHVAYAAAVGVMIVSGESEFRMLVQVDVVRSQHRGVTDDRLGALAEAQMLVVVGEIRGGRYQECDLRGGTARWSAHDKRDVVDR